MAKRTRKKSTSSGTQVVSTPAGKGKVVTKSSEVKAKNESEENQEEETLEMVKGKDFFFVDPTSKKGQEVKTVKQKKAIYDNEEVDKQIRTETIWFDYEGAKEFYLKHPGTNRPKGMGDVKNYADQYINGEWCLTDQGLSIDWDGRRVNGEHRLLAIFYAKEALGCDVKVPFRVTYNLEPRSFEKYDQLRKRSGADIFAMADFKNSKVLQEAVRHHALRLAGTRIRGGKKMTIMQLQNHLKRNKGLAKATDWVVENAKFLNAYWSLGHTSAMLHLARSNDSIPEGAFEEFLLCLVESEVTDLEDWNPQFTTKEPNLLRKAIIRKIQKLKDEGSSMDRDTKIDWMVAAFNSYIDPKTSPTKATDIIPPKGTVPTLGGKDFPMEEEEE